MKSRTSCVVAVLAIVCCIVLPGNAQGPQKPVATVTASVRPERCDDNGIAVTQHQILLDGKPVKYTARAGRLPIRDTETGEIHGCIFFVAYAADRTSNQKARPLTFLWNGGPGANSTYVHLVGFGPRHIKGEDDPVHPP